MHYFSCFSWSVPSKGTKIVYIAIQGRTWNVGKRKARSHVVGEIVLSIRRTNRPKTWRRRTGWSEWNESDELVHKWLVMWYLSWLPGTGLGDCFRSKHWAERKLVCSLSQIIFLSKLEFCMELYFMTKSNWGRILFVTVLKLFQRK